MPGIHYHMYMSLCQEPGHRGRDGGLEEWECGVLSGGRVNPPLVRAPECLTPNPIPISPWVYQYQSGPEDEASMNFPPGTGLPVGGAGDPQYLVVVYHFASKKQTLNGMTGVSGLDVTLSNTSYPMTPFHTFNMESWGYLGPQAVGTVTGSWTLKEETEIRLRLLYVHWHDLAIDVQIEIERRDNGSDLILHQDPRKYWGMTSVPDSESAVMRRGDRMIVTCTYNNTLDEVVRVE